MLNEFVAQLPHCGAERLYKPLLQTLVRVLLLQDANGWQEVLWQNRHNMVELGEGDCNPGPTEDRLRLGKPEVGVLNPEGGKFDGHGSYNGRGGGRQESGRMGGGGSGSVGEPLLHVRFHGEGTIEHWN
jgi:hypothetical protein